MAEKDAPSLGGFDLLGDMLVGKNLDDDGRKVINEPPLVDPEVIKAGLEKDDEKDDDVDETKKTDDDTKDDTDTDDTDSDDDTSSGDDDSTDDDDSDDTDDKSDDSNSDDTSDLGEFESDVTELLNSKFAEELGWDIPEEDAPKTVKEFVDMMKGVVAEASAPQYASEDIKALDEYVKQGGSLRNFYQSSIDGRVDTANVDMDTTFDQKKVVSENLMNQGYSETRINKMLKRWEDAGTLDEEAEDALELLKDYNQKSEQKLLEEQKINAQAMEEQQQKFVASVKDSIKSREAILGYKLSTKDKQDLEDSILTVDAEGVTPYQRKYMGNINNLLDSAFVTMKGDALGKKLHAKGKSDAVKNLHDKLKANKGNTRKQTGDPESGKASSGLSVLGSMLQGNLN